MNDLYTEFAAGKTVFREGDAGADMYIIERGVVEIMRADRGSDPVALLEVGDFFGEMAILEDLPRNASAVAKSDCRLLRIERASFADLLAQNVEIAVRIMRKLAARQRQAEQTVARLRAELAPFQAASGVMSASAPPGMAEQSAKPARGAGKSSAPSAEDVRPAKAAQPVQKPAAAAPVASSGVAPPPVEPVVPKPVAPAPAPLPEAVPAAPVPSAVPAVSAAPKPSQLACILVHQASGQRFALEGSTGELLIGRTDPVTGIMPEINLGSLDTSRSLSRRHAKLLIERGAYFLREEVGTANGTYVNGQKLAAGVTVPLKPGDKLRFGSIEMELTTV